MHPAPSHATSSDRKRLRAALLAVVLGILVLAIKLRAYHLTDSSAIFSDALENIANVLGAIFLVGSLWFAARPADWNHPYGHGKVEFLTSIFEGGLVGFAAVMISVEAVDSWVHARALQQLPLGLLLTFVAGAVNLALGLFLRRRGKETHSEALTADGTHLISDFTTSIGVITGIGLVSFTGWAWVDKVVALAVSLFLLRTSYRLVRTGFDGLMDTQTKEQLSGIVTALNDGRIPGIVFLHELRLMRFGGLLHIEAHLCLPEFWTLDECHHLAERFEARVRNTLQRDVEFHFHLDPCMKAYCESCAVEPCPIRQRPFQRELPFTVEKLLLRDDQLAAYSKMP